MSNDINYWDVTPDLSTSYSPVPKPLKRVKIPKNMKTESVTNSLNKKLKDKYPPRIVIICQRCKKEFKVYPYHANAAKACSYKCAGELLRTKIKTDCKFCNKEFLFNPSQKKYYKGAGRYCSRKCSYDGLAKIHENLPIKDKYGRTTRRADQLWKLAVRERDKCVCRRCGKYDPYIHTHHMATRKRRPDLRHVVENGICLCNSCHSWVHNNVAEAEVLGFLKTEKYELMSRLN